MAEKLVLLASSDPAAWSRVRESLGDQYPVTFAVDLEGTLDVLRKHRPGLLVLCSRLLDSTLEASLERLSAHLGQTRVVAVTSGAEQAIPGALWSRLDACIEERCLSDLLLPLTRGLLGTPALPALGGVPERRSPGSAEEAELSRLPGYRPMVLGSSPGMQSLVETARRVAPTDVTVLITGESGTGKEVLARRIHLLSGRARGPFVAVNLAAVPGELFESALFGHERGAFTGATSSHVGKFVRANNGTLFLDEIGALRLGHQAKLLRAIQEREVESVGGRDATPCNARVVAATGSRLGESVRAGQFRADLYYRLNVIRLHIPPLRERREDIPALVGFFLERYAREFGCPLPEVPARTMTALEEYPWPGNCRELENRVQRGLLLCASGRLEEQDLLGADEPAQGAAPESLEFGSCDRSLGEVEALYIKQVLQKTRGNCSQAAQILRIDRKTLRTKLERSEGRAEPEDRHLRSVP